jgi:type I restriction enzyme S subunit
MRKMKDCDFQWIGQIPEDWMMTKVKFVADFYNGDRGKNYPSGDDLVDDGIVFLTSNNIHSTVLDTNPEITKYITPERYKLLGGAKIKKGDLVFCLRGSIGLCSINESEDEGTVASSLTVLRPKNINNHFLNFILNSKIAEIQTKKFENGSCAANLSAENVGTYIIPYPPLVEQQRIADFLDEKCGEIDSIRSDIQKQIDILNDYKKSVITEAVTKGLNPKAKLKDSGIEWIEKIPEGWNVKKLKYLCCTITDGSHFSPETTQEGKTYITVSDVYNDKIHYEEAAKISEEDFFILERNGCRPPKGAVLLSKDGTVGRTAIVSDNDYVVLSSLGILVPNLNVINSSYLKYLLDSPYLQEQMKLSMAGSALRRITISKISRFIGIVPPLSEQKAIADYLDEKCSEIDATIADKQRQLETLDKYKKSLIFEYVTGKKEVLQ